ncbi:hypothetical protein [Methylocella sp.]|uniref:hypothetical protein n=1 Tax=Methylocella sp. TaxID=1978226 RepID=UPI0035B4D243
MVVLVTFSSPCAAERARPVLTRIRLSGPPEPASAPALPAAARGAPLRCLAGEEFAEHFHKWRASSGRRCVFSVFPVRRDAAWFGLPEFESAVALGVAVEANGERRRVAAFELRWRDGRFCGDRGAPERALAAGAVEWHVHLLAREPAARRALLADFQSGA